MPDKKIIHLLSTSVIPKTVIKNAAANNVLIEDLALIDVLLTNDRKTIQTIEHLGTKEIIAIFTSKNAISSVTNHLSIKPDWKIFCIDGVSKAAAINFFGEDAIIGSAHSAKALAEKIIAANITAEAVFFCGNKRLNDLPDSLEKAGVALTEIEVYNTIHTSQFINTMNYDAIAFFSPSAVESFFSVNRITSNITLFTIGQTTAAAIEKYSTNKIVISANPGKENLINTVIHFYKPTADNS